MTPFHITAAPTVLTIGAAQWPLTGWRQPVDGDRGYRSARTAGGELVSLVVWVEGQERVGTLCVGEAVYDLRRVEFADGISGEAEYSEPDAWMRAFLAGHGA
jgi:hypothetical protein